MTNGTTANIRKLCAFQRAAVVINKAAAPTWLKDMPRYSCGQEETAH
jgi:hypothetical protein